MIKNNLILALRHLSRNKRYGVINVCGLAIGIAACLVIYLLVQFEMSYDTFRTERDRIYRVHTRFSGTFSGTNRGIATPVGAWMRENVTGLDAVNHFITITTDVVPHNEGGSPLEKTRQRDIAIASPDYFKVFPDYEWLTGDADKSLGWPNSVVITASKAELYFGLISPLDAVGRTLTYRDSMTLTVSGIIADLPERTDLYFQDFISYTTIEQPRWHEVYPLDEFSSTNSHSQLFVKITNGHSAEDIKSQLAPLEERYKEENGEYGFLAHYDLQPFSDLHYNGTLGIFDQSSRSPAHLPTLYIMMGVALLLLLIAAINFVNLETAQSVTRAQEVGVRKVVGANKPALIRQFFVQTLLTSTIALLVALALARLAFWYFGDFIPAELSLDVFNPMTIAFLLGITLVVALLAGTYPAFVLASFKPALALKDSIGSFGKIGGSANLRRGLVVFQFVIAQVLIFGTLVVGKQIQYMINKDMGFKKDEIVYFRTPWRDRDKKLVLAEQLKQWPEVQKLSLHASPPAHNGYSSSIMNFERDGQKTKHNVFRKNGDTAYIGLYGIDLIAGRNIRQTDTIEEFVINEAFARDLGFTNIADAVGAMIELDDNLIPVVGVVANFHTQSLHNVIEPVAIGNEPPYFSIIGFQLSTAGKEGAEVEAVLNRVEEKFKTFYPDSDFNYSFLDETVANFYDTERRTAKVMNAATFIAILISCLGLLGLVAFAANQRTKEIGIRKVLGASVANIITLLSREFIVLVMIAFVLAAPLAWWAGRHWLEGFAYRIDLSWWLFILCALIAAAIALITMSAQAVRAANSNPADSLRSS